MNIYEQFIFNLINIKREPLAKKDVNSDISISYELDKIEKINGEIHFYQNKDYDYRQYKRYFLTTESIEKVEVIKGDEISCLDLNQTGSVEFLIDFDNKIDAFKFYVRNNLVDPFVVPVRYIDGDKAHYEAVYNDNLRQNYLEAIKVSKSIGYGLINIYFQPCCNKYSSTRIDLYVNNHGTYYLMQSYEIDKKTYWISISGLAPNFYGFILNQYDKENKTLVSTDLVIFKIEREIYCR